MATTTVPVKPETLRRLRLYKVGGTTYDEVLNDLMDDNPPAAFIREHLAALAAAMKRGADVQGYFHWSLVDNYEWGSYRPRFGLHTRAREAAAGAGFYAEVARTGELEADG